MEQREQGAGAVETGCVDGRGFGGGGEGLCEVERQ